MTRPRAEYAAIVVGGGFFGCTLAACLRRALGARVLLLERGNDLLERASYANQARVHNGYHYPRSVLTALRCRVNFPRFVADYSDAIVDDFEKLYAVARPMSRVTAAQFRLFCERIGAPIRVAPSRVRRLFDPERIEEVFSTHEVVFDALSLRKIVRLRVEEAHVEVRTGAEAKSVRHLGDGVLELMVRHESGLEPMTAQRVYNCTYSRLNRLLVDSGLDPLPLKHELTEMALVEVPDDLRGLGLTVMCGPFFSLMPFPPRGLHTLSHVRYTPHCEWHDGGPAWRDPYELLCEAPRISNFPHMMRDAARYVPAVAEVQRVDSLWEVKTVLPKSEVDDSRPVLFVKDCGVPNLTCILGAKIDNIYDVVQVLTAAGDLAAV